jgi:hypothetical protein
MQPTIGRIRNFADAGFVDPGTRSSNARSKGMRRKGIRRNGMRPGAATLAALLTAGLLTKPASTSIAANGQHRSHSFKHDAAAQPPARIAWHGFGLPADPGQQVADRL